MTGSYLAIRNSDDLRVKRIHSSGNDNETLLVLSTQPSGKFNYVKKDDPIKRLIGLKGKLMKENVKYRSEDELDDKGDNDWSIYQISQGDSAGLSTDEWQTLLFTVVDEITKDSLSKNIPIPVYLIDIPGVDIDPSFLDIFFT